MRDLANGTVGFRAGIVLVPQTAGSQEAQ